MTLKQVDKDVNYMKETFGTTCLITETGRADKILEMSKRREINRKKFANSPVDAWDI